MNQYTFVDIYAGFFASMVGSFLYSHLVKHDLISLDTFLFSMFLTIAFSLFIGPKIRNNAS